MNRSKMKEKLLNRAIFHAVKMWGDPVYERFLHRRKPGRLNEDENLFDWFDWFLGDWRVKRTIKKSQRKKVRRYFDTKFRSRLLRDDKKTAVDRAAKHIQDMEWSTGKRGHACLPTSLVSKIGFFLCPDTLVPYDSLARGGLKTLTKSRTKGENLHSKIGIYEAYHKAFDEEFKHRKAEIRRSLTEPWVKKLARRFRCRVCDLESRPLKRKVFDNYLMEIDRQKAGKKTR